MEVQLYANKCRFALAEAGAPVHPLFGPHAHPWLASEATLRHVSILLHHAALLISCSPITSQSVLEHLYKWVPPHPENHLFIFLLSFYDFL